MPGLLRSWAMQKQLFVRANVFQSALFILLAHWYEGSLSHGIFTLSH